MPPTLKIGEVIESTTTTFSAQCKLHQPPPFGSFVVSGGDITTIAVVSRVETKSVDPGRLPMALGDDLSNQDDVYKNNPHLDQLLRTDFHALIVGHKARNIWHQTLPPTPPKLHSFVFVCAEVDVKAFTSNLDFLKTILNAGIPATDALLAAMLNYSSSTQSDRDAFLFNSGKKLASLLPREVSRLTSILKQLTANASPV
ncbi:MAG: hypothetical protein EXR59_01515 [Dehalococcoidia bacterium]|nr:hypothetical protein [Dehalococcoidia bacterium]